MPFTLFEAHAVLSDAQLQRVPLYSRSSLSAGQVRGTHTRAYTHKHNRQIQHTEKQIMYRRPAHSLKETFAHFKTTWRIESNANIII